MDRLINRIKEDALEKVKRNNLESQLRQEIQDLKTCVPNLHPSLLPKHIQDLD